ncbi:MAG: hypothetical protein AAF560_09325 [Acidobacteriota bacterium]
MTQTPPLSIHPLSTRPLSIRPLSIHSNRPRRILGATLRLIVASMLFLATALSAQEYGGIEFPQGASSFADDYIRYDTKFMGGPSPTRNIEPETALGVPNGPNVSLGRGGLLEVLFTDNLLTNSGSSADDLHVFEVGADIEETLVSVRGLPETQSRLVEAGFEPDNGFFSIGKISGATSSIDIDEHFQSFAAGELQFDAVRLIDNPNQGEKSGPTVGADIDAVGAISSVLLAAPSAVRVIAQGRLSSTEVGVPGGDVDVSQTIVLQEDAILTVSSYGSINYKKPKKANAGVEMRIILNNVAVAVDQSFEDNAGEASFFASPSYSTFLKAGTHKLVVRRSNVAFAFRDPILEASYYAIAARDESN